ncbi:hypothetical protein OOZ15_12435 [Galbibacter sp. EGI 63066]|uniref:hypothetical protein n=1 Tax=Galbibacter sp. EGI 63066 TaxID=2993559 RepID=UPI002248AFE9|nr:hypothetical protein [Galbibacter sp. EGI 63066]MCX2680752.1 hypothetical protein [Galbibacter sp. EGI 63066]
MNESNNWKYKDKNLNLLENFNSDSMQSEKREKLLNIIDESKKTELNEIFENGLNIKYEQFKRYFYEINLFMFKELEYNISESINCLIIGANIASITNTNLILERALKLALIQYEVGKLCDYNDKKIINEYIEADKKYSNEPMGKNIQKCKKYKILSEEEAKELRKYKLKFRDGFSHFTPSNILKGENNLTFISLPIKNSELDKSLKMPNFQSAEVRQFAINNAEEHLKYVLGIINHLQHKVLEKYKEIKSSAGNKSNHSTIKI